MITTTFNETAPRVLAAVDDDAILRFTSELVQINSVNPNLAPGEGERAAAAFIAETGRHAGLKVLWREIAPQRPNVLCLLPGQSERIGLLFLTHTDTVPVLGMENPFSGRIADGYLWGRGSVDMKGGLAAALQATLALARSGVELEKSIALAAVIDEESEHRGAYALAQEGVSADACIVPEPSANQLLLGCKGTAPIRIDVQGVLAHASNPWLGVNAIDKAAKVVLALGALPMGQFEIPEIGATVQGTVNVGVIQGGTQYNNVADHCTLFLDRRMVPGETQATCLEQVRELLAQLAAADPQFRASAAIARPDWHWEPIRQRGLNPAYTPAHSRVARALCAAHRAVHGADPTLGFTNGYMDMDFMVNDLGIPSVNYGPGEPGMSHTPRESLRIDQLLAATRVLALAALALATPWDQDDVEVIGFARETSNVKRQTSYFS